MKKEIAETIQIAGITIAILLISGLSISFAPNHFRADDLFKVLNSFTLLIFFIICAAFITGLTGSVFSRFKNKLYIKLLAFSFFLLFSFGIYLFSVLYKPV